MKRVIGSSASAGTIKLKKSGMLNRNAVATTARNTSTDAQRSDNTFKRIKTIEMG